VGIVTGTATSDVLNVTTNQNLGFTSTSPINLTDYLGDTIFGLGGDDQITGGIQGSSVFGGNGNDTLTAGTGIFVNTSLFGDAGNDTLYGARFRGDDVYLFGGTGNDTLINCVSGEAEGGPGADRIIGSIQDSARLSYRHSNAGVTINLAFNFATGGDATGDVFNGFSAVVGSGFDDKLYGSSRIDALSGLSGNDFLSGGIGGDYLNGGLGNDLLMGGDGDDNLVGGGGADTLYGGNGIDTIGFDGRALGAIVNLTTGLGGGSAAGLRVFGVENISGTDRNDSLTGNSGGNSLRGYYGNDTIFGGIGNDYLVGDDGLDRLYGGAGNDIIEGGFGADFIYGGDGIDTLTYNPYFNDDVSVNLKTGLSSGLDNAVDVISGFENAIGSAGNDLIIGNDFANILAGGDGGDTLQGGIGNDNVYGDDGIDTLLGNDGSDKIFGGLGNDFLYGGTGNDTLFGDSGQDTLYGGDGIDIAAYISDTLGIFVSLYDPGQNSGIAVGDIYFSIEGLAGSEGEDTLIGNIFDNVILGRGGSDFLNGYTGNDTQFGEGGDDIIYSEDGDDKLFGGAGNDQIEGGNGNDHLSGGIGQDNLLGELGRDVFVFSTVLDTGVDQASADVIADFNSVATDRIDLSLLDAKLATAVNDAFSFVAVGGFTASGQVIMLKSAGNTYVAINNDGDLSTDLMIRLNGLVTLDASDFIL
jgi:Ca2+-binding RTX toxin-like protein